ncbi:MAG: hypothetical protein Q4E32_05240 [Bacteroidales bacterium]|nr:hypothetical protein [Bacteroidales bacterium]
MKTTIIYLTTILLIIMCSTLTSCGFKSTNGGTNESEQYDEDERKETPSETTWNYYTSENDLTHDVTSITAYIKSTNSHEYDKYGNTARLTLSIQYPGPLNGSMVLLTFEDEKGWCKFSDFQGSGFFAVFDNGDVDTTWKLVDMGRDRKSLYIYYDNKVQPFMQKLKSSKTVRIQVNLEDVGMKTFDFNVSGLKWDY